MTGRTQPTGKQIADGSIQRDDLDVATVGQAVVRKVIAGANISLSATGADSGTGDVTVALAAFIALGTNPAGQGVIRLPNLSAIYARNAANTGDLYLILADSNNVVQVGNATGQPASVLGKLGVGAWAGIGGGVTTPPGELTVVAPSDADGVRIVGKQATSVSGALSLYDDATARGYFAFAGSGGSFFGSAGAGDMCIRAETGAILLGKSALDFAIAIVGRNLGVGTMTEFGSGVGVLGIHDAVTAPTTTPASGGVAWSSGGHLHWRSSNGTDYALTPPGGSTKSYATRSYANSAFR